MRVLFILACQLFYVQMHILTAMGLFESPTVMVAEILFKHFVSIFIVSI